MANTEIHVGGGGRKHKARRVLIGAGIVLAVAALSLGAGVGVRWLMQQNEYDKRAKQDAITKEASEAQDLALSGDFDKAHETINSALDNPRLSDQAKYDLFIQQAVTYENQQKFKEALESYREAEALKETLDVAQSIARMAEALGDKDLAISYYQKAKTLVPDDDAMRDSLKKYFDDMVLYLQGGQPQP